MHLTHDEVLLHYGVLGMKWGKRKVEQKPYKEMTTKKGTSIGLYKDPPTSIAKLLRKYNKNVKREQDKSMNFTLKNKDGKIGDMQLYEESKNSMNVVWVGINTKSRGEGYATAAMVGAIEIAKKKNKNKVTLEVPGTSPDALHVYKKLGFRELEKITDDDDVWGGLTSMELLL